MSTNKFQYRAELNRMKRRRQIVSSVLAAVYTALLISSILVALKLGATVQSVIISVLVTAGIICIAILKPGNDLRKKRLKSFIAVCFVTVTALTFSSGRYLTPEEQDIYETVMEIEEIIEERNPEAELIARAWEGFGFAYGDECLTAFVDLVLNRVDRNLYGARTIADVINQPGQWQNWIDNRNYSEQTYNTVCNLLETRQNGAQRTIPADYLYFYTELDGMCFLTKIGGQPLKIRG